MGDQVNVLFLVFLRFIACSEENCDQYCLKTLLPVEPFQINRNETTVIQLENYTSSLLCPPEEYKHVIFECSSWERCHCNTSLAAFKHCFGHDDTTYCDYLDGQSENNIFIQKCGISLREKCTGKTFPTPPSTTTTSVRSTSITRLSSTQSSPPFKNTQTSPYTTVNTTRTTSSPVNITTPSLDIVRNTRANENSAETSGIAVLVIGLLFVFAATIGIYMYKQRRRRVLQINSESVENKSQSVPLSTFTDRVNGDSKEKENDNISSAFISPKRSIETQKSSDSGIDCNIGQYLNQP